MSRLAAAFTPPMALDFSSETPLYQQIFTWFQRAVLSGRLQPGQRVPSTRALARDLCISRIPVLSAYDLLIAEGYLQAFVGTGTCVSRSLQHATRDSLAAAIISQMGGLLEIADDEADLQLVALLPPGMDDGDVAKKLPRLSAAVYALSECHGSRPARGGLVIGYAKLGIEEIPAMLEALKTAILHTMPKHWQAFAN